MIQLLELCYNLQSNARRRRNPRVAQFYEEKSKNCNNSANWKKTSENCTILWIIRWFWNWRANGFGRIEWYVNIFPIYVMLVCGQGSLVHDMLTRYNVFFGILDNRVPCSHSHLSLLVWLLLVSRHLFPWVTESSEFLNLQICVLVNIDKFRLLPQHGRKTRKVFGIWHKSTFFDCRFL